MKKGRENFALVLILLLVASFFFAFFRIADTQNLVPEFPVTGFVTGANVNTYDCGNDLACFIAKSKTCSPAKVINESTIDFWGMLVHTKTLMKILGEVEGKCVYSQMILEQTFSISDEATQQAIESGQTQEQIDAQIKAANDGAKEAIGLVVTCNFSTEDIAPMLERWSEGTISSEDLSGPECVNSKENVSDQTSLENESDEEQDAETQDSESQDSSAQDTPSGINTEAGSSEAGTGEEMLSQGIESAGTDSLAGEGDAEQETAEPVIKKIDEEQQKKTPAIQMPSLLGSTDSIAYIAAIGFFVIVIAIIVAVFLIRPKKNKQGTTAGAISAQNQMQMQQQMQQISMRSQQPQQIDSQIASYVYQMRQSGYNAMQIRQQLASSGWQQPQIDELFRRMGIF